MPIAYIALGSNLGDRMGQMQKALELLASDFPITAKLASPVYQNRAVGMGEEADDFLNGVVEVDTLLKPLELLDACLDVELRLERTRSDEGWAPRTIDLDVLYYEGVELDHERLTLPHPRIAERDFVAVPLADISPNLLILGKTVSSLVASLETIELEPTEYRLLTSNS